jgi:hypothetical protein
MGDAEVRVMRAREMVWEQGGIAGRKDKVVPRRKVVREDRKVTFEQLFAVLQTQLGVYLNVQ